MRSLGLNASSVRRVTILSVVAQCAILAGLPPAAAQVIGPVQVDGPVAADSVDFDCKNPPPPFVIRAVREAQARGSEGEKPIGTFQQILTTTTTSGPLPAPSGPSGSTVDELLDGAGGPEPRAATPPEFSMPTSPAPFEGQSFTRVRPPDTVGDVGTTHYVQMVNTCNGAAPCDATKHNSVNVFTKQGVKECSFRISRLWALAGANNPCATREDGDPIVLYDHVAKRWLLSQFATPSGDPTVPPVYECVAISKTDNPVNTTWYLYSFKFDFGHDYPKLGLWPDPTNNAFFMSSQRGYPRAGLTVFALEREQMLAGNAARVVHFGIKDWSLILMPADLDGRLPPLGTPGFFARHVDNIFGGPDRLELFAFAVNWLNPNLSTFVPFGALPIAIDTGFCLPGSINDFCVPQLGSTQKLDVISLWAMWRLQYRNFCDYETLVFQHTDDVNNAPKAAPHWYELRRPPGGAWTIHQQGKHTLDGLFRWMGSAAMDRAGDIALGYSISGTTDVPGIRYSGRLVSDPLGTMPQAEFTIEAGGSAQEGGPGAARWGDYSSLNVDPVDDCTFWYTNEYMPDNIFNTDPTFQRQWQTKIAGFRFPTCNQHFMCYKVKPVERFQVVPGVSLRDQFGPSIVKVEPPDALCAPADKRGEDPGAPSRPGHLKRFRIQPVERLPRVSRIEVTNQFGTRLFDTVRSGGLLVPTAKSLTATPDPLEPKALDHYLCYKVKRSRGQPKFQPVRNVPVKDQFGLRTVDVTRPSRLCNPVDKNGEDVDAPSHPSHLMCYHVRPTPSSPAFSPVQVYVNDQFGPETLNATALQELCVPSTKCVASVTTTTTSSSTTTTTIVPLDHFTMYNASGPFGPPEVTLVDQFTAREKTDLGPVLYFLPPADKNGEGVNDPVTHLTCYDAGNLPNAMNLLSVDIENQFGPQTITVTRPLALCVPSEKDPQGPTPPPLPRDHFECYEADGSPLGAYVALQDQFVNAPATVEEPFLFCNPVWKTVTDQTTGMYKETTPITDPDEHLTCYLLDPPGPDLGFARTVRNQFGQFSVDIDDRFAICVPSLKKGFVELGSPSGAFLDVSASPFS